MNDHSPFGHMPTHKAYFEQHGKRLEYDKHQRFIRTDDPRHYMYFIDSGYVKISWTLDNGDERIITVLPAGISLRQQHSIYDLDGVISDATTFTPSVIWRAPEELFFAQMKTCLDFTTELTLQGFRAKDYLIDQLVCLGEPTIYRRALRWLLLMAHWYGQSSSAGVRITPPLTQEIIGNWLHASRASISPIIKTLTEKGLIVIKNKQLTVVCLDRVKEELGLRS